MVRSVGCNPELSVHVPKFRVLTVWLMVVVVMDRVPESLLLVTEPSYLSRQHGASRKKPGWH